MQILKEEPERDGQPRPPVGEAPNYREVAAVLRMAAKAALDASHIKPEDYVKYTQSGKILTLSGVCIESPFIHFMLLI